MVSIVIPTYNRNDFLSSCLDALFFENLVTPDEFEVIVSDDSVNNIAKELIEQNYPLVKWVAGPKKGPAANRNNGAKNATGEWLLFLDDDCLPQKEWLSFYINAIKSSENDLVFEGCTRPDRRKLRFDEEAPINLTGNNLWSCNFAINAAFFAQLNGFDEAFPFAAMEDVDFHKRVSEKTHIIFLPKALVIHPWRRIKPFGTFKKHLKSHQFFANKHKTKGFKYRLHRTKIFAKRMVYDFNRLSQFSFRGWQFYVEKCALNFCLIFI